MLDVTLLGCAALLPLPERALTAALARCAGHSVLFDCGEGTQSAARKAGVALVHADVIALTHYHGDHIFGLPGLLQTMGRMGREEPLILIGPEGLEAQTEPILRLAGELPYEIRLRELRGGRLALSELGQGWPGSVILTAFPTRHRTVSQGYCLEIARGGKFDPERARALGVPVTQWRDLQRGETAQGRDGTVAPEQVLGAPRRGLKFVFSGDTSPCEALDEAARDADLLICEATYGENEQAELAREHGHMNFAQAGAAAARAGAKRLWLAHYSQMIEEPGEYLPNARAFFSAAECGADGMRVELRFPEEDDGR